MLNLLLRHVWIDLLFYIISRFNEFDHKFFGITESEADFMDPQQKLLLQCTYRALEDAGMAMESISGSRTGVYIGDQCCSMIHLKFQAQFYETTHKL